MIAAVLIVRSTLSSRLLLLALSRSFVSSGAIVLFRRPVTQRQAKDYGAFDITVLAPAGSAGIVISEFEKHGSRFVIVQLEDGSEVKCFASNVELLQGEPQSLFLSDYSFVLLIR